MRPWNDWFHVNGHTYGTWLRGDPRGWRARNHREHVDGDYRNPPPPGRYDRLHDQSKGLMNRAPVHLSVEARQVACRAMLESLHHQRIEVAAISVDDHHYHILARFPIPASERTTRPRGSNPWTSSRRDGNTHLAYVRHVVGLAKSRSARAISESNLVAPGGVWAIRFKVTPVSDQSHFANVERYVLDHARRGATVVGQPAVH
jgi:hypothetical protein